MSKSPAGSKHMCSTQSINEYEFIAEGRWLKTMHIFDEVWIENHPIAKLPEIISHLSAGTFRADIFTCSQPLTLVEKQYEYATTMDNFAVAETKDYDAWAASMSQAARKNFRRAARRGVTVGIVKFDEELVEGIKRIYDETPFRQGRRFPHYQKSLDTVRAENATYLDRAIFVGAHYEGELIGFFKMVMIGHIARIMQIVSKDAHADKRPTNALLNEAVKICSERGAERLVYGHYIYDNKKNSPVTEFKRRNAFHQVEVPRYHVPLTLKGKLAIRLGLHHGWKSALPEWLTNRLLDARSKWYRSQAQKTATASGLAGPQKK